MDDTKEEHMYGNYETSYFGDEEGFLRRTERIDLYDDHVEFILKDGKAVTKSRTIGRRRQSNAGK